MLLATSILSALVVGFVGYTSGKNALQNAAFNLLTQVRESRAREITSFFDQLKNSLVIYTRGSTAIEAVQGFIAGFDALKSSMITPAQETALDDYYSNTFIKGLEGNTGNTSDPAGFVPTDPAQKYLQANYTAPSTSFDESIKVDDAGDGSAWSATHAQYHDYFRELVDRFQFEDALLLDTNGNVVYSAYSGADLGTNVETGPYRDSNLADAYKDAMASNAVDFVELTDYARYQPSYGVPTAWAVSPIGSDGVVVRGAGSATADHRDQRRDDRLRRAGRLRGWATPARPTWPAPTSRCDRYPAWCWRIRRNSLRKPSRPVRIRQWPTRRPGCKGTVLLQTTSTEAVQNAAKGQSGTIIADDYLGQEALVAYAPLQIEGLRWVIVAKIDAAEAFQPVTDFTRNLIIATVAMIVLVCLASLILAQIFVRPVRKTRDRRAPGRGR